MNEEKFSESAIPWMDEDFIGSSTVSPDANEESSHVMTVVIFVVLALIVISLIFVIAVFIDYRQQKLIDFESKKARRLLKLRLPRVGRPVPVRDDERNIVTAMEVPEPSTSHSINVIV